MMEAPNKEMTAIYLHPQVKAKLKDMAEREKRSVSQQAAVLIERELEKEEQAKASSR